MTDLYSHQRGRERPSGAQIAAAIVLTLVELLVVIPFSAIVLIQSFTADSCYGSQTCDYGVATASEFLTPSAAILALLVTIPMTAISGRRGRSMIIPPVCGIVFVILVGIISIILNNRALS